VEIRQIVLPEFEEEMKKTRALLERVPEGKQDYKPHEKSMAYRKNYWNCKWFDCT